MTKSTLIPIIRKMMPSILAQEIVGVQPMTSSTGSIFDLSGRNRKDKLTIGEDFTYDQPYWAEPDLGGDWEYRHERYQEIHEWTSNTFGRHTLAWNNPRWSASNRRYWFKNEKDRTMFVLKWS